jgi:putative transport protein
MTWSLNFLHEQPLMLLFLSLGLGTLLGRLRVGILTLGSTASTLLVGLIISAGVYYGTGKRFTVPTEIDTIFLQLFIFAIGLKLGPQFFSGLRQEGYHLIAIGLITATLNFAFIALCARLLHFAPGLAAGTISGSYTITAVIGVASGAVDAGAYLLPDGMTAAQVKANIAAGYAATYITSTLFCILMVRYLPTMFGIDPVAAARKTTAAFGGSADSALPGTTDEFLIGYQPTDIRAYSVQRETIIGQPVLSLAASHARSVLRLMRGGKEMALAGNPLMVAGDTVSVFETVEQQMLEPDAIGHEVNSAASRDFRTTIAEIVILNKQAVHKTLAELHETATDFGLYVKALFRHAQELPLLPKTELLKGDVLRVYGTVQSVEMAGTKLGAILRPSTVTDIATLAFGIVVGFLIGALSVHIFGIPFGLGTSGGVILSGIIIGTIRTYRPRFGGPVPEGARGLMQSIGLDMFIAVLALNVAPDLVDALSNWRQIASVFLVGLVAALLPAFIAWLVGLYVFKMDPMVLIGAVAGSRNSTPSLNAIQQQAKSTVPSIGYPVPYALTAMIVLIYGYIAMVIS